MARRPRPAKEHKITAEEAGLGRVSWVSIVAGTLCAYGAFAIVAAVAGSVLAALDVDTEFRTDDWASSGLVAGIVTGVVLLIAYGFGGYVAGRMARRAGMLHGLAVALLSLVLGAIVGAIAGAAQDSGSIRDELQNVGVPTSWDQVEGVAIASVIISLVAIVVGGILGGIRGERWHTALARRVADPEVGPAAAARSAAERDRERAERFDREHDERVAHDELVAREARQLEARRRSDHDSHDRHDDHDEHHVDHDVDGRADASAQPSEPWTTGEPVVHPKFQPQSAPPAAPVDLRDEQPDEVGRGR